VGPKEAELNYNRRSEVPGPQAFILHSLRSSQPLVVVDFESVPHVDSDLEFKSKASLSLRCSSIVCLWMARLLRLLTVDIQNHHLVNLIYI